MDALSANLLFDPSDGWFCPNLLGSWSANPLFDPSDGWFLPELARRFVPLIPHPILYPSSFLPTGGSCPNLPEFVLLILHPSSLLPMGGSCPNLPGNSFCSSFILHPSSFLPMGGFARTCSKFVLLILHPFYPSSFLPTGGSCPNLLEIRSAHPSSLIPHPSFRRVVLARTCPEIRSAKRRPILVSSQPRIRARAERRNRRSTPCEDASARRAVLSFQKSP